MWIMKFVRSVSDTGGSSRKKTGEGSSDRSRPHCVGYPVIPFRISWVNGWLMRVNGG